jgi:hypothetical protein
MAQSREAQMKAIEKQAWMKVRMERRAYREAALGWQQRVGNLLICYAHFHGNDKAIADARELFGIRFKPREEESK